MSAFDLATENGVAAEQRMRTELVGWLTTVARDGTPQSSPVAFLWDGEVITIWSETSAPKVTNLVENHRCSFHLNSNSHGLEVVSVEGTAHLPPDGSPWNEVPGFVEKYAGEFRVGVEPGHRRDSGAVRPANRHHAPPGANLVTLSRAASGPHPGCLRQTSGRSSGAGCIPCAPPDAPRVRSPGG